MGGKPVRTETIVSRTETIVSRLAAPPEFRAVSRALPSQCIHKWRAGPKAYVATRPFPGGTADQETAPAAGTLRRARDRTVPRTAPLNE